METQTTKCTLASHAEIRDSAFLFARLIPVCTMADLVDDEYPVRLDTLELANCVCGSTLSRVVASVVLSGSTVLS